MRLPARRFGYDGGHEDQPIRDRARRCRHGAVSSFWAGLLGGTVNRDDDWHDVMVDGETKMAVQLAPDHVKPDWPNGSPQQVHFDIFIDDLDAVHDEVIALGATMIQATKDPASASGFQVYADPAGHAFASAGATDSTSPAGGTTCAVCGFVRHGRVEGLLPSS